MMEVSAKTISDRVAVIGCNGLGAHSTKNRLFFWYVQYSTIWVIIRDCFSQTGPKDVLVESLCYPTFGEWQDGD
jgi:hypothetical protein